MVAETMNNPKAEEIVRRLRGLADEPSHPRASEFLDIAADHLEVLEAELEAARPHWISVKERLPEKYTRVLAYSCGCFVAHYTCTFEGRGFVSEETEHKLYGVTHWMPLPEPPKE